MTRATVSMTLNGTTYEAISVTRTFAVTDSQPYYYTFAIAGVQYFTYGGPTPVKDGQHFTSWKQMSGGTGFTVTDDAVFTAQFRRKSPMSSMYIFYYENGIRAGDTLAVTKS